MKKILLYILTVFLVSSSLTFGQTVYTWIGGSSGNWHSPSNWSPMRTNGQVTDIILFNCGTQVTVNSIPQQTIGQLIINGNTNVILIASSGQPKTLSVNGGNGDDFLLESGSSLQVFSDDPRFGIYLNAGATASINGTITFRGNSENYLNAHDANSVIFNTGSVLTQLCPGSIFTSSGTPGIAIFKNGSKFISNNSSALSPFGLDLPLSKIVFEEGSIYSQQNSMMPENMFSGRTFACLEFDLNVNVQYSEYMTSDVAIDEFIVKYGCIFTMNNTNSAYTESVNIKGDINIDGSFSILNSSNNRIKLILNGQAPQHITGSGTIGLPVNVPELRIENPAGITLEKDIVSLCPVIITGKLNLTNNKLTSGTVIQTQTGIITRNNGYIIGRLCKYFQPGSASSSLFEIGTQNGYSPVTLTFEKLQNPGYVSVSAAQTVHPLIQNQAEAMKRYWTISGDSLTFSSLTAELNYRSCDFNTNFTEPLDEGNMVVKQFKRSNSIVQEPVNISSRDTAANKIQVSDIRYFGDFTIVKSSSVFTYENLIMHNNSSSENSVKPNKFNLSQNYPNPFNPSTKIEYSLPLQSKVELKVYDINGKEVRALVNKVQEAGFYTVDFNSENLSSGVYFYKLTTSNSYNSFTTTKKMVIAK